MAPAPLAVLGPDGNPVVEQGALARGHLGHLQHVGASATGSLFDRSLESQFPPGPAAVRAASNLHGWLSGLGA